jgi:hypothetical protein
MKQELREETGMEEMAGSRLNSGKCETGGI